MESWQVVVFLCLASRTLGLPQAVDSDSVLSSRLTSGDHLSWSERKDTRAITPLESQLLKRSPSQDETMDLEKPTPLDESIKKVDIKKDPSEDQSTVQPVLSGVKLNVHLPDVARSEGEDNVRTKKSTSVQEMQLPHPHTTTVCIQVRSDHQPKVVCGDPLSQDKKDGDASSKPRFAYRMPSEYFPHTPDQPSMSYTDSRIQQGLFRAAPRWGQSPDTLSDSPSAVSQASQSPLYSSKSPILKQGPSSLRPKTAAGSSLPVSMYPLKRSEEEPVSPKGGDSSLPQPGSPGSVPIRINPPGISPNSVIVHKQYYPYTQGFLPSFMAPSGPSPLRLNCATDGGFIPYVRSAQPTSYVPIEERLIVNPMASRMSDVSQVIDEQQGYIVDSQARQAVMDNIVGSPYIPALLIDEDGQTYMIGDSQSRNAMSEQEQSLGEVSKEDTAAKERRHEEELQRSKEKLEQLEKQLNDIKAKTSLVEEKKDVKINLPEGSKDTQHDSTTPSAEKKIEPIKNSKRNVFRGHVMNVNI